MNNHRYTLEKYAGRNSRYSCPACGKAHRFTRYIDTETGQHLAPHVGRCDREVNCAYHYTPKQYFEDTPPLTPPREGDKKEYLPKRNNTITSTSPSGRQGGVSHTTEHMAHTLGDYYQNNLVWYLINQLGEAAVHELLQQYRVGTHHHWQGSTVFWYVDHKQDICSGKVMLYDGLSGKRVKKPVPRITWMHSVLGLDGFSRSPCFFGEHLLHNSTLPVCMVESEKTALVAAHYLPGSIWLATGGISHISIAHCRRVLKGRSITLFPDAGGYEKWAAIAQQLRNCSITPMIEHLSLTDGEDLADMLLRA